MSKLKIHTPSSLSEILDCVEAFQNKHEASWYRGSGSSEYPLVPSLARRSPTPTAEELSKLERQIGDRFAQRSPPFVDNDFTSEWKKLFYMQHYGIPTRLLDWTESPFIGLYFALTSVERRRSKPIRDVALWLCDPVVWNRISLAHISFVGKILDENCEEIKAYSPSLDIEQRATIPIMIYGTHNSPRIVAQRGVFALFGKGTVGMEEIFNDSAFPNDILEKIVIKKDLIDRIVDSLYRKGFSESAIYPDITGLSLEVKRIFGYH